MNAPVRNYSWMRDTFVNLLTNLGVQGKDRSASMNYALTLLGPEQLHLAYRGDWIARKVIDIPAQDGTRAWRNWQMDKEDITKVEAAEKKLNVPFKLQQAIIKARLFGGSVMIIGVDKGNPEEELDLEKVGKDSLKFIHVCSRWEVSPGPRIGDLMSPWYGQPEYYERNPIASGNIKEAKQIFGVKIHPSRVVRLLGSEYPDMQSAPDIWSDSALQVVDDAIRGVGTVAGSLAQLITDAKVDVMKIPNLTKTVATAEGEARLTKRFSFANASKGIINALLMDKEEEWERMTVNFAGMPEVLQMYLLIASGAADIPVTRLLGQSPAGMNATGESDIRNYYDRVNSDQKMRMTPALEVLDQVTVRSALGTWDEAWFYNWNSLWQLDDVQKAALAKSKADTFKIDNDSALIPADILREAREAQLIEDGFYPGFEQIVEDWEAENGDQSEAPDQLIPPPLDPNAPIDPNAPVDPNAPPVDPKADPKAVKKPGAVPPPKKKVVGDRQRRRITLDGRLRTLYVHRKVLNTADIIAWAREQGFDTMLPKDDLHVTVMYSKAPVDWSKIREAGGGWGQTDDGTVHVAPGGPRMVEKFDGGAIVLQFASSSLSWRHEDLKYAGCQSSYDEYNPHITITYNTEGNDINEIVPYRGPIVLGPEVFEEIVGGGYEPNADDEVRL